MVEKIKLVLRIKTDSLNEEITDLIEACKLDLSIAGIKNIDEEDPLIKRAITIYCKANFGIDNSDSEKLQKSYDLLKLSLALCSDYNEVIS